MHSLVVVVFDDADKLILQILRVIVMVQQNHILHCAVEALDLALCLRMIRRAAGICEVPSAYC